MAQSVSAAFIVLFLASRIAVGQAVGAETSPQTANPLRHAFSVAAPSEPTSSSIVDISRFEPPAPAALPPAPHVEAKTLRQAVQQPKSVELSPVTPHRDLTTAAPPMEQEPEDHPAFTRESLAVKIKELQDDANIDQTTKTELLKRYKAAEEWLKSAEDALTKTSQHQAEAKNAPEALIAAKSSLAQPVAELNEVVPADVSLPQVEQRCNEAESNAESARTVLEKIEEQLKRRADRKTEITRLADETKLRLEESQKLLATSPATDEAEPLLAAREIELQARVRLLRSQLVQYKAEAARNEAESELLPARRELAKREKTLADKRTAFWKNVVTEFRKRETEEQAAEARRQVQKAHPALRELAQRNAALAEQRKTLVEAISQNSKRLKSVSAQTEKLVEQFKKAEERVEKAGHSTTVGLMLRRQREELPNPRECQQRMREIENAMPLANLALIEIEEEREFLGDLESVIPATLQELSRTISADNMPLLEQTLRELLKTKIDLLDSLAADYQTYLSELSELELDNNKLDSQITKSSNYIGEHVLWIRSAGPIGTEVVVNAARGAVTFSDPAPWVAMAKHCGLDMLQRPLIALGVFAVVVLIVVFHARLRSKIANLCIAKSGSLGLRFRPTLEAVVLAAIVATEWPLLLAYLGWQMSAADANQDLTLALGSSLIYGAGLLWTSDFVLQLLRKEGIAESHFGWSALSTQLLKRELRWLVVLGVPLAVVVYGCERYQEAQWSDSLGRLAFVGGMFVLANFMHSILNKNENVLRQAIIADDKNWFEQLRKVSYLLGVGVPCVLAILAVAGYYYSAQQVALRWQGTLGISLALLLVYSIAARWCLVRRRNLAVQQARERQRIAAESATTSPTASTAPPLEDQQLDLSAIHEQLRYLLRHAVTLAMILSSWFVWSDFLPALRVLDHVVLWEKTDQVVQIREAPDGKIERIVDDQPVTTTLRHALFAGLLIVATVLLGRYLPALLEVTVLQRLPFDFGGRHAISVLFKYSLALTGIFLACRTLSITWSSVQWLAAGMTVGLGFGLQEIFANFVSGLILLFERPIRVGDVITLGDITGTVTNMRIRATTVTNWDRKELIVPNKDLVTGRLLNWTLTDTTNRIVIKVGVAYRSDPDKARQLILDAVTSHPNVLVDPAPSVTFEEFADSALNLIVRAYIASMDLRLGTIHDLHAKLHKVLGDAGIEIAFPQRDIHVHGLDSLALGNSRGKLKEAA